MRLYDRIICRLLRSQSSATIEAVISRLVARCPNSSVIYENCCSYINGYRNENNDDFRTNGELRFMKERLVNCEVVFDVGANIGDWAAIALEVNPSLSLHCFEPSRPTFERLLKRSFQENARRNHFGLGSAAEVKTLHVFEEGAGHNSLYQRRGLEDGWNLQPQTLTETVRLETLDWYCAHHGINEIDFLKLDVEGHELSVFQGASEFLGAGKVKAIQFEYGGCNIDAKVFLKDIFEFFGPLPYSFFKLYPNELRPVVRYDQRLENFQFQNWAIIRNG